jgi:hypothetical protein
MIRKTYMEVVEMELWKNIEESTNYEISNLGNVRNTKSG